MSDTKKSIKIIVEIEPWGNKCGCCSLINSGTSDDDPVTCTAFNRTFGSANVDDRGRRIRLPECLKATMYDN